MGRRGPTGWPLPRVLLFVLIVVGLLTVLVAGSVSSQAFNAYNSGWDGTSGIRTAATDAGSSVVVLTETTSYVDAENETVAFVIAPTQPYSSAEIARMRAFVERGGTVVIAEDVGEGGNQVLSALDVEMRFDGRLVADQRHHGPRPEMLVATNVTDSPYTRGVDRVMLNHGTVLTNTSNATVFVQTSEFAYLDQDVDGNIDNASMRRYPIAAVEPLGRGVVVAVSDPSVFINAMQDRASNAAFVRGLVGSTSQVYLDYSHAGAQPPNRVALLWLRQTPIALAAVGVAGVALVGWMGRRGLPTSLPLGADTSNEDKFISVDERSLLAFVSQEHPDWSREHVRRVIAGIMTEDRESETDE